MALGPNVAEDQPSYQEPQRDVHECEEVEHAPDDDLLDEDRVAQELWEDAQDLDGQDPLPTPTETSGFEAENMQGLEGAGLAPNSTVE